jgi:hypothetical protein
VSLLSRGRLICLTAMTAMASLSCLTVAHANDSRAHIDFRLAKRQIQHFTAMTCTSRCRHRAYDCHRHSPSRVSCHSWTFAQTEGVIYPENEFVVERETCKWVTVATPYRGSATKLRLQSNHFRCRVERTDKNGKPFPESG